MFIINGKHFPVTVGDLIVANPNTLHMLQSARGIDYHCLLIFLDFFDEHDIDVLRFQSLIKSDTLIGEIFKELKKEFSEKLVAANMIKKSIVYRLIVHLERGHRAPHGGTFPNEKNRRFRVRKL